MLFKLIYDHKRGLLRIACFLNFKRIFFALINRRNALTLCPSSFDQIVPVMNDL